MTDEPVGIEGDNPVRPWDEHVRDIAAEPIPGSPGGVIEAVKRAVVVGLRELLTGITLSDDTDGVNVDMEYPLEKRKYPSVWVQFSMRKLQQSGLDPVIYVDADQRVSEWRCEGQVTVMIVALSSLERDRISDTIISEFAFSNMAEDSMALSRGRSGLSLRKSFAENPHVFLTVVDGELRPGGQGTSLGVPWDESQLSYEDTYSFDVVGDFQRVLMSDGSYVLRRVDVYPEVKSLTEWQ